MPCRPFYTPSTTAPYTTVIANHIAIQSLKLPKAQKQQEKHRKVSQ